MCERAVSVEKPGQYADWKEEKLEDAIIWGRNLDRMSLSSSFDVVEILEIGLILAGEA